MAAVDLPSRRSVAERTGLANLLRTPGLLLAAPAVVAILGLFLWPMLRILILSFTEPRLGLDNYRQLVDNTTIHRIALTTLRLCGITTILTVLLGYVIAYAMVHARSREVRLMTFCILLTFWLSVLVRSFAWLILLRGEGVINQALMWAGVISAPLPLVRNEFGVILGMVHVMLPLAILPLYAALRGIDMRVMTAARSLGCGPLRAFWWVYLPLSRPGLVAATVLVFIFSLGFFVTPALLGGGKVIMIAEYIRTQFERSLRWGYAAMLASALLAAVLLSLALASRFVNLRRAMARSG